MSGKMVLLTEAYLEEMAEALRIRLKTEKTYKPSEFAEKILEISGGKGRLKPLTANMNGVFRPDGDVDGFNSATVNVPTFTASLSDDAIVLEGPGVSVEDDAIVLGPSYIHKSIAANGDYYPADDGADGYSAVSVNVVPRLNLLDPDVLDNVTINADNTGSDGNVLASALPGIIRSNSSAGLTEYKTQEASFGGIQSGVIRRQNTSVNALLVFGTCVHKWKYSRLCLRLKVLSTNGSWGQNRLMLSDTCGAASRTIPSGNILKTFTLTNKDWTADQINSQTGITIHTEDGKTLAEQLVTIDISEMETSFFVSLHNISSEIILREIYAEA